MARRPSTHPTDAELEILQVLWRRGPASLGGVHEGLSEQRSVAKTTVATMLNIMLEKKLVRRGDGPRGYVWSAAVARQQAASGMLRKLIDNVFDGSAQRMVAHLVEGGRLSEEELRDIAHLIERRQKAARHKKK